MDRDVLVLETTIGGVNEKPAGQSLTQTVGVVLVDGVRLVDVVFPVHLSPTADQMHAVGSGLAECSQVEHVFFAPLLLLLLSIHTKASDEVIWLNRGLANISRASCTSSAKPFGFKKRPHWILAMVAIELISLRLHSLLASMMASYHIGLVRNLAVSLPLVVRVV